MTDRQKVEAWLTHIGAVDPVERGEVLKLCAENIEARRYYVARWASDCGEIEL